MCLLLALGGFWVALRRHSAAGGSKAAAAARGGAQVVPVVAGKVAQRDVPIYLDGLGTVQAFNTVTVRVRVDGQLQRLAFVEGQDVHPGDVLAQIDPDPYRTQLEQDEAKQKEDEAQLANARVQLERDTKLLAQNIVAQQDYDAQKALVAQLAATVSADQAAVDSAKVQLNYTRVVSPIEGRTGIRLVDAGNIVKANDPNGIVVITQLRPISVVFTLPEQTLNEIQQQRSQGELSVLAVGRDNRTVLDQGKLAVIDNQIDTTTGTIKLKATFPNVNLRLWPGQFVNARLLLDTRKNGITVPATVIQRGPLGSYAFVIRPDMKVDARPVKVAQTADGKDIVEDGQVLIESGLQPGESVVVDGQYKLQIGSRVKPSPAAKTGPAANPDDPGP
ncbi:MAG: efflux RND transporter periplasmic adaptor subunit [Limisphaerales bacterium]